MLSAGGREYKTGEVSVVKIDRQLTLPQIAFSLKSPLGLPLQGSICELLPEGRHGVGRYRLSRLPLRFGHLVLLWPAP